MRFATRSRALALLAPALLIVTACGENLGPEETLTLPSTAALDGYVYVGSTSHANANGGGEIGRASCRERVSSVV